MSAKAKHSILLDLFSNRIWSIDTVNLNWFMQRLVRFVKLMRITVDTFAERRMGFQCVALSYFCALATVPLAAVIFAVTGGLGLTDQVVPLLERIMPFAGADFVNIINEKAANIINAAKSSGVGLISALTFIWTIIWLLFQVERVFNNVWGIRKVPRKLYKRFSFYLILILLIPFIVLVFGSGIALYTNMTKLIGFNFMDSRTIAKLLGWVGMFAITAFTLTIMYKYIPAAWVRWDCAIKSAITSAVVFMAFQYIYLETQLFVTRLNAVYGAIAAIPLYLIWMNMSWQIVIYGAQLCYGYQNVDSYHIK